MTDQILDRLIYQGYEHIIYAISGDGLLSPKDFGITPSNVPTSCFRGYYMIYICNDNNLSLRDMTVFAETYPPIKNFSHYRSACDLWEATIYTGSCHVKSFTGGLLVGRNLRRGLAKREEFLSMNFWLASRTIIELRFKSGILQNEVDYSDKIDSEVNKTDQPNASELMKVFPSEYDFIYPHTLAKGNNSR